MYYFASDMHLLGLDSAEPDQRTATVLAWLDAIEPSARALFLVGDVFDFWFEYKRVIPKGYTLILNRLRTLVDRGVEVHLFIGNHDMWQRDYLEKELKINVHLRGEKVELYGKKLFITHGDDIYARRLGGGARIINSVFRSPVARWLFSTFVHPNVALRFGRSWSSHSRKSKEIAMRFKGDQDPLVQEALQMSQHELFDYFVFGHNHCAEVFPLPNGPKAIFLGHWFEPHVGYYATLDSHGTMELKVYKQTT